MRRTRSLQGLFCNVCNAPPSLFCQNCDCAYCIECANERHSVGVLVEHNLNFFEKQRDTAHVCEICETAPPEISCPPCGGVRFCLPCAESFHSGSALAPHHLKYSNSVEITEEQPAQFIRAFNLKNYGLNLSIVELAQSKKPTASTLEFNYQTRMLTISNLGKAADVHFSWGRHFARLAGVEQTSSDACQFAVRYKDAKPVAQCYAQSAQEAEEIRALIRDILKDTEGSMLLPGHQLFKGLVAKKGKIGWKEKWIAITPTYLAVLKTKHSTPHLLLPLSAHDIAEDPKQKDKGCALLEVGAAATYFLRCRTKESRDSLMSIYQAARLEGRPSSSMPPPALPFAEELAGDPDGLASSPSAPDPPSGSPASSPLSHSPHQSIQLALGHLDQSESRAAQQRSERGDRGKLEKNVEFVELPCKDSYVRPSSTLHIGVFFFMENLCRSMAKGARISETMFMPRRAWYQSNIAFKALDSKMRAFDKLRLALLQVMPLDASDVSALEEGMAGLRGTTERVQKKLATVLSFVPSAKHSVDAERSTGTASRKKRNLKTLKKKLVRTTGWTGSKKKAAESTAYVRLLQAVLEQASTFFIPWTAKVYGPAQESLGWDKEIVLEIKNHIEKLADFFHSVVCAIVLREMSLLIRRYFKHSSRNVII